jgi:hypothetical protein
LGVSIELVTQDSLNKVEIPVTDNLEINFKTIWNLFYGAGLSKRYRPDSSATYMEPYIQVMAWWAFQKKYLISLRPWNA